MCKYGFGGNLREGDHLVDLGIDGSVILKCLFKKWDDEAWSGLLWLRTDTCGGFL